uniref:Toll-3 n=1 Tax=Scylla paramamosain TaxID=85552 RepID=A0A6M4AQP7_SCYPA|nr:toll-3 [Scylla paramamosain]QVX27328.1 toll-like receptor 3 [Scylla paramamosain]
MWSARLGDGRLALVLVVWQVAACGVACQGVGRYSGGDKCESRALSARERALSCSLKALEQETRVANLSRVAADSVVRLSLGCNAMFYFPSVLSPHTLSGFVRVRELNVEFCKLSELEDNVFINLKNLRNLTIRTRNWDWPQQSLAMRPDVFRPLHQLQRLNLSTNSIWELPAGAFCHLGSLKQLNLSHNHLQDMTQLGFGESGAGRGGSTCRSGLRSLDLSYNDVTVLMSGSLQGLFRLQELWLHHNELTKLDDNAFKGLSGLHALDLSHNRLVALPEDAFLHTPELESLHASNNSLAVLAPGIFRSLKHLVELDLSHNELKSEWLTSSIFEGLIRLRVLSLAHNKITQLSQQVFHNLYGLQVLQLSHNQLATIPAAAFARCVNLHQLDLSYNQLTAIPDRAFQGVDVLSFLALDNNRITEVAADSLDNLTNLADLNLNGNQLTAIPEVVGRLGLLKTLDLGENHITSLDNMPVKGLQFLYGLRLVNNRIAGNISKETFSDIPSLKILNLAKNSITHIESGTFDNHPNLQAVRLDANKLTSIHNLFEKLPNLVWLNVSDNNIEVFDYHFIPVSLQWLDLHKNRISELGNYLDRQDLNLQTLDASFNTLEYINSIQIPDSVQLLFLNDNKISTVEPFTFFKKENLTRVDLFANQLSKMDMSALRLNEIPANRSLPEFYLGGNPFVCDCKMEWLQRINGLEHERQNPIIMDLETIYCQMPFARTGAFIPLVEVNPSQFLCQYETHCFALCHCCEFDACDCEMTCPDGCGCYHDQSWRSNIVDCSLQDVQQVPERIPMDATQVYLDGNNLKNLSSHSFIGRKHLQVLYVNASSVKTLDNGTFSGLTRLTALHLEDNLLEALRGNEFQGLQGVRELYLHNNRLRYIHQHTFATLFHLETLTLQNNLLTNFPVWRLVDNPYLSRVSLGANHWSCQCQFVESFGIWLNGNDRKVVDGKDIKCYSEEADEEPGSFITDFNVTTCMNSTSTSTVIQPMVLGNLLHPVIATCASFVVVVLLVLCFLYRGALRVWVFSRCGFRMCHKAATTDDRDKLFDAFVSYSSKDEAWVNQVLAGELERGERPYRVCLHYRDFPVTAYIADTIVEAVESSRRTIIVLSKNFIENEWCRFQFKSAHHEVFKKRRQRLIVVVLGEIPSRDLDPDLRLYLKTNTCIKASDSRFWEKLRFAMPDVQNSQRVVHAYSSIPERSSSSTNKYSVNSPAGVHHNLHASSDAYWA